MKKLASVIPVFLIFVVSNIYAQPRFQFPIEKVNLTPQFYFQSWKIRGTTVSQLFTPIRILSPINQNIDLLFLSGSAFSNLDDGNDSSLNGLVDSRIRVAIKLNDYRWLINLGVNLPSGKNSLNSVETDVNNFLTETILGFPVKRYGRGFDIDLGSAYAWSISEKTVIGVGFGYLKRGSYGFQSGDSQKFRPGDEFSMTVQLNFEHEDFSIYGNVLTKFFQRDKIDDRDVFKEGPQFELEGRIVLPLLRNFGLQFAFKNVVKLDNESFDPQGVPGQLKVDFVGNSFWLTNHFFYNLSQNFSIGTLFNLSIFGDSDVQLGNAHIISVGPSFSFKSSEHLILSGSFTYATGKAENSTLELQGISAVAGLSFRH